MICHLLCIIPIDSGIYTDTHTHTAISLPFLMKQEICFREFYLANSKRFIAASNTIYYYDKIVYNKNNNEVYMREAYVVESRSYLHKLNAHIIWFINGGYIWSLITIHNHSLLLCTHYTASIWNNLNSLIKNRLNGLFFSVCVYIESYECVLKIISWPSMSATKIDWMCWVFWHSWCQFDFVEKFIFTNLGF